MSSIQASVPGGREIQHTHGPRRDAWWAQMQLGDQAQIYFGGGDTLELPVTEGHWRVERRVYQSPKGTGQIVDVFVLTTANGNIALRSTEKQAPHVNVDVRSQGTAIGLDGYGALESVDVIAGAPIE